MPVDIVDDIAADGLECRVRSLFVDPRQARVADDIRRHEYSKPMFKPRVAHAAALCLVVRFPADRRQRSGERDCVKKLGRIVILLLFSRR
jgi:hypothetical protein